MSRCVPSWGDNNNQFTDHLHDPANPPAAANSPTKLILSRNLDSNVHNSAPEVPNKLDYEVAELTWENGQLALHGLGQPRIPTRLATSSSAATTGTLESIVNQATCFFNEKHIPNFPQVDVDDELVPWFHQHSTPAAAAAASAAMTMDALVPLCPNTNNTKLPNCPIITCEDSNGVPAGGVTTHVAESCSTGGIMNSQAAARHDEVPVVTRSEYSANSSRQLQVTLDSTYTDQRDQGTAAFTSTTNSIWSADNNTSSGMLCRTKLTGDDHDSISLQSRSFMRDDGGSGETKKKGSSSIKRSRAAAIHNQSERKRRDKINQRMKTLQKLVPNSNKTDKASMLDEVIEYLKQLQAQVTMVNRMNMNIPQMTMMPMTLNQQALQMSMMTTPMGMGGMLDMNAAAAAMAAGRANMAVPVQPGLMHPSAFMPMQPLSWDQTQAAMMPDPMSAFLPCQSQPMTMESYRMMASLYQQMQHTHQLNPNSKT